MQTLSDRGFTVWRVTFINRSFVNLSLFVVTTLGRHTSVNSSLFSIVVFPSYFLSVSIWFSTPIPILNIFYYILGIRYFGNLVSKLLCLFTNELLFLFLSSLLFLPSPLSFSSSCHFSERRNNWKKWFLCLIWESDYTVTILFGRTCSSLSTVPCKSVDSNLKLHALSPTVFYFSRRSATVPRSWNRVSFVVS